MVDFTQNCEFHQNLVISAKFCDFTNFGENHIFLVKLTFQRLSQESILKLRQKLLHRKESQFWSNGLLFQFG